VLGCAVRAELTVTFIGLKFGLFNAAGPTCVGELRFDDLRADPALLASAPLTARRLTAAGLQPLAPRQRDAHKGDFGRLLVIGGERGTGGATLLAAQSALRCGAGLVSVATREAHVGAFLARCPEVMVRGLESANQALPLAEAADVLVVGPGLGQGAWARSLLSVAASRNDKRQVWDADALNLLAAGAVRAPAGLVLTPHPGEAARLLGWSGAQVQAERPRAALELARRFAACVVLKGAGTLIATPDGELALCDHGHPAMAGAGLGDVLAGIIGALLAQDLPTAAAARLAVWLHARAGERLGGEGRGIAASDLIAPVRQLLEEHSPCLS
jgi:NAD(P)H-hydrate epimerase